MHLDGNITKEDITEERKLRENNKPDEVRDNVAIEIKKVLKKYSKKDNYIYLKIWNLSKRRKGSWRERLKIQLRLEKAGKISESGSCAKYETGRAKM